MTIDKIISDIIETEGGFVNHANDRGGATKYGITLFTLSDYRGREVTTDDVANLSKSEAGKIYKDRYIIKPKFNCINDLDLLYLVVDGGVHSGVKRSAKWLQQALNVDIDGVIGPITINTVNSSYDIADIKKKYLAIRLRFLGRLITSDPKQAVFAAGWSNRIAEFIEEVL